MALLQVLLERRSGRDGLAGILILVGIRVTGIGHSSGSDLGSVEDGGGAHDTGGGGEGVGRGHEGSEDGDLVLLE